MMLSNCVAPSVDSLNAKLITSLFALHVPYCWISVYTQLITVWIALGLELMSHLCKKLIRHNCKDLRKSRINLAAHGKSS